MDYTSGEWAIQVGVWDGVYWTSAPVPNARGQSPALTVMPEGALYLAWQDRVPLGGNVWGKYDIYASEHTKDTWSPPVNVSQNREFRPNSDALGAHIVPAEGFAHIAWINDKVQVRYCYGRGQYWPIPMDVTDVRAVARGLSLRVGADNTLYVAWDEGTSPRVTASAPRTKDWPKAATITTRGSPANSSVFDVSLATGGNGVSVAWVQRNAPGNMGIFESRYNMDPVVLKSYISLIVAP
jgi:hypothetical protein